MRLLRIALAALVLPFLAAAQAPARPQLVARLDSLAGRALTDQPVAGLAVAVVRGGDTLLYRGYGKANIELDVAATPQSVFEIGSITKQFTSALIMRLVEQKRLSLDDTLGALLPSTPAAWHRVTLRQLLNHTSGIRSYTSIGAKWASKMRLDMAPDSIIALVRDDTLDFAPGTKWSYDNTGYILLGMILDRTTKVLYPQLVRDSLFAPLGMKATLYCDFRRVVPNRASGYDRFGNALVNTQPISMTQPYAAGALCSTVGDLVTWTRALHAGRVVSRASFAQMTTPVGPAARPGINYGFGLGVDSLAGHRRVQHNGGINGFISYLAHYPDDSLTVVVLSNSAPSPANTLGANLARAAFGLPLIGGEPIVALAGAARAAYPGRYRLTAPGGDTTTFTVTDESGKFYGQMSRGPRLELLPIGKDAFVAAIDRAIRITFVVKDGRATGLTLDQGGVTAPGVRVEER